MAVIEEKFTLWASRVEAIAGSDTCLFDWLLQQPQEDVLKLLALCVSASVNTVASREDAPTAEVSGLMNALSLDMADWWEPTAATYLSHVGKDRIIGIVSDAVSPQIAQTLTKLKKGELVKAAEEKLSGLRWLPDNLKKATTYGNRNKTANPSRVCSSRYFRRFPHGHGYWAGQGAQCCKTFP